MKPIERNPTYTNLLIDSASLYLRQHAHNPVFWYPWGEEAIARARAENKPIFLSVGYSSCYWCHVMEREIFENPSIAALMNQSFINIKVDREEHPDIDDIYMVARQLLKGEGGWPNNVFLTPQLEPFYAGGTYAPDDTPRRPSFPRLVEWIHFIWSQQESEARRIAAQVTKDMLPHLVYARPEHAAPASVPVRSEQLFAKLKEYYDSRAGGFFQAPKFPHENYLQFLLGFYEATGKIEALDMVTNSLAKMAAGGLQDQVGCGFHRYAIDKEWYIPHFEKMLYNQAQLARLYTDCARLTGNPWLADVARSILDFVAGPMTSGTGGFYAAIDAETEGVEGAHYAWSAEQLSAVLTREETTFLTMFYALADIPQFPGHKHVEGQVLIARKPLDQAAREHNLPYEKLAAMVGELMNKLLRERNKRPAPRIDDKILVGWNGLMIDAFAHAGKIFNRPGYTARAREAADFILEKAIDNEGHLKHVYAGGRAYLEATLEDYAFLIRGLITLWRATPDDELLQAATALADRAHELFSDNGQGYFCAPATPDMLVRRKTGDDSAIPGANAIFLHDLIDLHEITGNPLYGSRAQTLADFFLAGTLSLEHATLMHAALRLHTPAQGESRPYVPAGQGGIPAPDDIVTVTAVLFPEHPAPGAACELLIALDIKDGWHIGANRVSEPYLIPTQIDIQGVELLAITYPQPLRRADVDMPQYEGLINITTRIRLPQGPRPKIKIMARFQPCHSTTCHAVRDVTLTL